MIRKSLYFLVEPSQEFVPICGGSQMSIFIMPVLTHNSLTESKATAAGFPIHFPPWHPVALFRVETNDVQQEFSEVLRPICTVNLEAFLLSFRPHCAQTGPLPTDMELHELQERQVHAGKVRVAFLDKELSGDVFGVTYRRMASREAQRPFISVIDCRGEKASRSYFTK
jgi:hypothetical protein